MKRLDIVLVFLCFLVGCKAPQEVTNQTSRNEKKDIAKDISLADDSQLYEAISRGITTAISEKLNWSLHRKIYDTDKPVDPETGKHPLKEENDIHLAKDTQTNINDSARSEKSQMNSSLLIGKTKDKTKTETKEKTHVKTTLRDWEKIGIGLITILVIILIIYLTAKFKK